MLFFIDVFLNGWFIFSMYSYSNKSFSSSSSSESTKLLLTFIFHDIVHSVYLT